MQKKNTNKTLCILTFIVGQIFTHHIHAQNNTSIFDEGMDAIKDELLPAYSKSLEKYPYHNTNNLLLNLPEPSRNLIQKLRKDFSLDFDINRRIESEIKFIKKNNNYMKQVLIRSRPFLSYIVSELKKRKMPLELALLPIVESAFDPFAYSYGQAAGLWQLIPVTATRFGIEQNWWFDGRRDVINSTKAALDYLTYLHKFMKEDWLLAIAAYNSGEGNIDKAIKQNKKKLKPTTFWDLEVSKQTSAYVPRLLALVTIVKDPKKYNIELPFVSNEIQFQIVDISSQIDLSIAAELAEIELNELYTLNAGYNRWATSPSGPHRLLIPMHKTKIFKNALASLPEDQKVKWKRHQVSYGETLSEIALKYNTTALQIKLSNDLSSNVIRSDSYLMIPVSNKSLQSYKKSKDQRKISKQNQIRTGERIEHIINRGESLWLIGRRYKVDIKSLAAWNNMSPKDTLSIGEKLIIWSDQPSIKTKPVTRKLNYSVKNGDSLYLIAKKFRVTIVDLARWNNLDQKNILKPGQNLILHIDVRNQSS
ncbi:MAG: LysM peptidoglycan-binding domain-containing protein [Pseudomonadota bacterium]|nr:LysM peptidoglycan-binding domain-containing protein [Pseudomonadota bacterium]